MIKRLFLCLLLPASLAGCIGDSLSCDGCEQENKDKVDVTFQVGVPVTKAIGEPPREPESSVISNFQVFVFTENNTLETTYYAENPGNQTTVTLKVVPGRKDFYAVVNYNKKITDISSKEDLAGLISDIRDTNSQQPPFLMVAQKFNHLIKDLPDNVDENDVELIAARLVSRIQLRYKLDFSNSNYRNKEFYVDSVYILNGNTKCNYSYVNDGGSIEAFELADGLNNFRNPHLDLFCHTGRWEKDAEIDYYPGGLYKWFYFYTFPNQSEEESKQTMIVISAMLDGSRTYYPIIVNDPETSTETGLAPSHKWVTNNAVYLITATIKGRGSDVPDVPVEYVKMNVNVNVDAWDDVSQEEDFKH